MDELAERRERKRRERVTDEILDRVRVRVAAFADWFAVNPHATDADIRLMPALAREGYDTLCIGGIDPFQEEQ